MTRKQFNDILIYAAIVGVIVLIILMVRTAIDANKIEGDTYMTHANYTDICTSDNILYQASASEAIDNTTVYYQNGAWVRCIDGELYNFQQYVLPNDKGNTLINEVNPIPYFNKDDATFMAFDLANGSVLELDCEKSYNEIIKENGNLMIYIEWSVLSDDKAYYYSYVMQPMDVSVLYCYTEPDELFRNYTEYIKTLNENAEKSEAVKETAKEAIDTAKESTKPTETTVTTTTDEATVTVETNNNK